MGRRSGDTTDRRTEVERDRERERERERESERERARERERERERETVSCLVYCRDYLSEKVVSWM